LLRLHPPSHRRPAQAGRQAVGAGFKPAPTVDPAHAPAGARWGRWKSSSLQASAYADALLPQVGRQAPDRAFFGLLRPLLYHDPTIAQETHTYKHGGRKLPFSRACAILCS